jgi:hypothetical protein
VRVVWICCRLDLLRWRALVAQSHMQEWWMLRPRLDQGVPEVRTYLGRVQDCYCMLLPPQLHDCFSYWILLWFSSFSS